MPQWTKDKQGNKSDNKNRKIMKYAGNGKIDEKYDKKFYDYGLEIKSLNEFLE